MIIQWIDNFQLHRVENDVTPYQWYHGGLYIAGFTDQDKAEKYRDRNLMNHKFKQKEGK